MKDLYEELKPFCGSQSFSESDMSALIERLNCDDEDELFRLLVSILITPDQIKDVLQQQVSQALRSCDDASDLEKLLRVIQNNISLIKNET